MSGHRPMTRNHAPSAFSPLSDLSSLFDSPPHSTIRPKSALSQSFSPRRALHTRGDVPYSLLEKAVKSVSGADAVSAIRDAQAQCYDAENGYQSGNALWYYVSLMYFGEKVDIEDDGDIGAIVDSGVAADLTGQSVTELEGKYLQEIAILRRRIHGLLTSYDQSRSLRTLPANEPPKSTILSLVKDRSLSVLTSSYLHYYDQKLSIRPTDVNSCRICGSSDSSPILNSIMKCSSCEVPVHMRCYGLLATPSAGHWLCDQCKVFGPRVESRTICVLCSRSGGVLKSTIQTKHWRDETRSGSAARKLWVHIYCAAGSASGATVKCHSKNCESTFHGECWRRDTHPASPWPRVALGCKVHCGAVSHDWVNFWEANVVREVLTFAALLYRSTPLQGKAGQRKRPAEPGEEQLSQAEARTLLKVVARVVAVANARLRFAITLNRRTKAKEVTIPKKFTVMAPDAVRAAGVALPGRSPQLCYEQYRKMYDTLKKRMKKAVVELTDLTPEMRKDVDMFLSRHW